MKNLFNQSTEFEKTIKDARSMNTVKLRDIELRVEKNSRTYLETSNRVLSEIQKKNLRRGRVRPKDPTESKILARFSKR
ncbi:MULTISPECIES: hypothetical protein [Bacillaceae]|jgi:hypothetical protein|uniref:Uncharacterized protein n=2 Tax=Bacillaceae TaxID=186817 RepID=A0A090IYX1_9BACI|nr:MULTISPECIES: hypothetical protein [Bacillaceae]MCB5936144.1 hypothetical protein [Bacillus sp. DFI.2.34]NWN97129.1 hypothetical protein [Bacillus sp. (in: firmicutes)]MBU5341034.1 hypothetical protein [Caldifermentibacillus hisashii]MCB7077053.1 hypothetical protein [Caldibacillus thermoamylovorans]MCM3054655.1 hypothetical protein [Caldibacillus thermoamylovorans]